MHCNTIIITTPNNDPGHEVILDTMKAFTQTHDNVGLFANLGSRIFLSVMSCADIMIGNSSSGIHEAVSFRLPVVNAGSRQAGRLRPRNVIDCEPEEASIRRAISQALSDEFRETLVSLENPYGDGHAAERIVTCLEQFVPFEDILLRKSFCDGPDVWAALAEWMRQHE